MLRIKSISREILAYYIMSAGLTQYPSFFELWLTLRRMTRRYAYIDVDFSQKPANIENTTEQVCWEGSSPTEA